VLLNSRYVLLVALGLQFKNPIHWLINSSHEVWKLSMSFSWWRITRRLRVTVNYWVMLARGIEKLRIQMAKSRRRYNSKAIKQILLVRIHVRGCPFLRSICNWVWLRNVSLILQQSVYQLLVAYCSRISSYEIHKICRNRNKEWAFYGSSIPQIYSFFIAINSQQQQQLVQSVFVCIRQSSLA
jgi:hypothetical protein